MKKLLRTTIIGVSMLAGSVAAADYPDAGRFKEYEVRGTAAWVIKDTITGCEYLYTETGAMVLVEKSCK